MLGGCLTFPVASFPQRELAMLYGARMAAIARGSTCPPPPPPSGRDEKGYLSLPPHVSCAIQSVLLGV